jgi:hypothetical protein
MPIDSGGGVRGLRRALLVVALASVVACVASSAQDTSRSAPGGAVAAPPAAPPAAHPELVGPRIFDWTTSRIPGRSTHGIDPSTIRPQYTSGSGAGWSVTTGAAVTSDGAIYGSWSSPLPSDLLFFGVDGNGANVGITGNGTSGTTAPSKNFFALDNLHLGGGATVANDPVIVWSASLAGGIDSSPALSLDGSKVFVAGTDGTLHCLQTTGASQGTICSGWTDYATECSTGVHGSSPWINYSGTPTEDIYLADTCGRVHRVNGSTGAKQWAILAGASGSYQTAIRSGPIVLNGYIYAGDDMGQIFRITDGTGASAPTTNSSSVVPFATCSAISASAPCPGFVAGSPDTPSPWAVRASLGFDVKAMHAYAVANDYMFELNGGTGAWAQTAASPIKLGTGGSGPMLSPPVTDTANGYIYTALNNKLVKLAYPFAGGASLTALAFGSGSTQPSSSTLAYDNSVYVGDATGHPEAFDCANVSGADALVGSTPSAYGTSITTGLLVDYDDGDLSFGFTSGTGGGYALFGLALGPQSSPYFTCPGTEKLCTGACTGGGGMACQACCVTSDCGSGKACVNGACVATTCTNPATQCTPLPTNTSASCGDAGACEYTCLPGYANCTGTTQTQGCPVDVATDPNNCGACGTVCSSAHIPVPVCASGVCAGQCADGWVDCDSNRQSNGCESAATCGACCAGRTDGNPSGCTTGTTCYDTGGLGMCVSGQSITVAATASENGSVTITCPESGTETITAITFADYGTPGGTASQSNTPWNPLACASNTTSPTCVAQPGCAWSGSACAASCSTITTAAACTGACTWNASLLACEPSPCSSYTQTACDGAAGCTLNTSVTPNVCVTYACENLVGASACALAGGCSFDQATGTCTSTTCENLNAYSATPGINTFDDCDQTPGCSWNAGTGVCEDTCATLTNACGSAGCTWDGTVSGTGYVDACVAKSGNACLSLANECATSTLGTWNGTACSCSSVPEVYCSSTYEPGCTFKVTTGCTGTITGATDACDSNSSCVWQGGWLAQGGIETGVVLCNAKACEGLTDACDTTSYCSWNGTACANTSTCATKTNVCGSTLGCAFDTAASRCTAATGFLHDYGSSQSSVSPNTFRPECALDVSANASFTACVGQNACTISAVDDSFGTGAVTPNGSTLPLAITPGPIANYPRNPCPTYQKRLYLEAACGTCP